MAYRYNNINKERWVIRLNLITCHPSVCTFTKHLILGAFTLLALQALAAISSQDLRTRIEFHILSDSMPFAHFSNAKN